MVAGTLFAFDIVKYAFYDVLFENSLPFCPAVECDHKSLNRESEGA